MNTPHRLLTGLACSLLLAFALFPEDADARSFTDKLGRAIEGELVSITGDIVKIKRTSDGQVFNMKASDFSRTDQAYFTSQGGAAGTPAATTPKPPGTAPAPVIPSAAAPPMRMEVKVYPNKNDRPTNNYIDDRMAKISFRVDIRNGETARDFSGGKAIMIAFAKDLQDSSQYKVISREEYDVTVQRLQTLSHDTKEVKLTYDNIYYKYGFKYSGYLLILKDQTGKTVTAVGSSPTVEKFAEEAFKLV